MLGPLGKILVRAQALGQVRDGFDTVGAGGGDDGHRVVANHGAILGVVVEGAGEIADRDDERLFDEVMPCPGLCRVEIARASKCIGSLILGEVGVGIVTDSGGR